MKIGYSQREMGNWLAGRVKRALGRRGEEGAALLEFALTLPLLLAILTGTASISLGLYILQEIGNADSAGAQCLAGIAGNSADPCAWVATQIAASLPNLTLSNASFTVTVTNASGTTTYGPFTPSSAPSAMCTAAGNAGSSPEVANYPVTVTVTYVYSWLPVMNWGAGWSIFNVNPTSNLTATETLIAE
ncbi:MAG: TadE/TadG family type IV pilus assembly protein [Terracidiphilus sp.]